MDHGQGVFVTYDALNVWSWRLRIENSRSGVGRIRDVGARGDDSQWDKGHMNMKPTPCDGAG